MNVDLENFYSGDGLKVVTQDEVELLLPKCFITHFQQTF